MLMERVAGCWWNDWPDVGGTRGRMAWNTHSMFAKPRAGQDGTYLQVRKSASEKAVFVKVVVI